MKTNRLCSVLHSQYGTRNHALQLSQEIIALSLSFGILHNEMQNTSSRTVCLTLAPKATLLCPSVGKRLIVPSSRQIFRCCRIFFVSQRQEAESPPRANSVAMATANTPQSCVFVCVYTFIRSKWRASEEHLKKEQIFFFAFLVTLDGRPLSYIPTVSLCEPPAD